MIGQNALIIDDDVMIQEIIRDYISHHFTQEVTTANSLNKATALIIEQKFDLITLDIGLGAGNGASLIKYIEEHDNPNKNTPIIICSGYINPEFQERFKDKFAGIIIKPFRQSDFDKILRQLKKTEINSNSPTVPTNLGELQSQTKQILERTKKIKLKDAMANVANINPQDLVQQTELLVNITSSLAKELEWSTDQTLSKLIMACLMHDMALDQLPELAKYWDRIELELNKDEISPEDYELVRNHPLLACEKLEKLEGIDEDVLTIIKQHHERPDGTGFPVGLKGTKITPLSALFIVAHDLQEFILRSPTNWSMQKYLDKRKAKLAGTNFQKIIEALEHPKKN